MTTGSIGGFLDVLFNFNTQALLEDNIIGELARSYWVYQIAHLMTNLLQVNFLELVGKWLCLVMKHGLSCSQVYLQGMMELVAFL